MKQQMDHITVTEEDIHKTMGEIEEMKAVGPLLCDIIVFTIHW